MDDVADLLGYHGCNGRLMTGHGIIDHALVRVREAYGAAKIDETRVISKQHVQLRLSDSFGGLLCIHLRLVQSLLQCRWLLITLLNSREHRLPTGPALRLRQLLLQPQHLA